MRAVVNVNPDWGIGKDNGLWCIFPEDMKRFKDITIDNAVVYGRKTLMSLPGMKPLKGRTNIVLSSSKNNIPDVAKVNCNYYACIRKRDFHGKEIAITGITINRDFPKAGHDEVSTSLVLTDNIDFVEDIGLFLGHQTDGIFICGGADIYKQFMDKGLIDTVYVTKNDYTINGVQPDSFFPNLDSMKDKWVITSRSGKSISTDTKYGPIGYEFLIYKKLGVR